MIGDTLWVWQALESPSFGWSQIQAYIPFAGVSGPLQARSEEVARRMKPIAVAHGQRLNMEVRLARFDFVEIVDYRGPGGERLAPERVDVEKR